MHINRSNTTSDADEKISDETDETTSIEDSEVLVDEGGPAATHRAEVAPSIRDVLRVLWARQQEHLVRSEIYKRLNPVSRPTLGRIGQILAELSGQGLLSRTYRKAQGSSRAAAYVLSPRGRDFCRSLGLGRDERDLFPVMEGLDRYLSPKRITQARDDEGPGRLVAFYAHRGGVGSSTAVAYTAHQLATRPEVSSQRLLVADFGFDSPGLDDYFAPEDVVKCRGLRGLIVDYYQIPEPERAGWLKNRALMKSRYVLRASSEIMNLFYLPSGFAPDLSTPDRGERAEALARLWEEAGLQSQRKRTGWTVGERASADFLSHLRQAFLENFDKALLDSETGTSLGAWAATHMLADELVLCTRISDKTVGGLQLVLANFIKRNEEYGRKKARVTFMFAPSRSTPDSRDQNSWIEKRVLGIRRSETSSINNYRSVAIKYDNRLEQGFPEWNKVQAYDPLRDLLQAPAKIRKPEIRSQECIPLYIRLLLEEIKPNLEDEAGNKKKEGILKGSIASYLSCFDIGLYTSLRQLGVDEKTVDLIKDTQKAMRLPGVNHIR